MPRIATLTLALLAVLAPHAAVAAKERRPPPKLQVKTDQQPSAAVPGSPASLAVSLIPPDGVVLNRYPGIKIVFEASPGLRPDVPELFAGSRQPIEDPEQFYYDTKKPLRLDFVAVDGAATRRTLRGTLSYFYCVKASGFCAPGRQKIELPVKVAVD